MIKDLYIIRKDVKNLKLAPYMSSYSETILQCDNSPMLTASSTPGTKCTYLVIGWPVAIDNHCHVNFDIGTLYMCYSYGMWKCKFIREEK